MKTNILHTNPQFKIMYEGSYDRKRNFAMKLDQVIKDKAVPAWDKLNYLIEHSTLEGYSDTLPVEPKLKRNHDGRFYSTRSN